MPVLAYKDHFPELGDEVFSALLISVEQADNLRYNIFYIMPA